MGNEFPNRQLQYNGWKTFGTVTTWAAIIFIVYVVVCVAAVLGTSLYYGASLIFPEALYVPEWLHGMYGD